MLKREEVVRALDKKDYAPLYEAAKDGRGVLRVLISLTYDKQSVISWRAVEALGLLAGEMAGRDPEAVRNLAQRLLWMMRDESGNNPWGVPEVLGEIVRNSSSLLSDLPPIIASFHDEEMLRPGVLRALERIAGVRPDLVMTSMPLVEMYLKDGNPDVRAYAALLGGRLRLAELLPAVEELVKDDSSVTMYEGGDLVATTVGEKASEVVILLRNKKRKEDNV
ncbi:MAG: hypothetical protein P8013_12065 [Candidatus Sulfobium sp.]|jgi:HEAT repeat protein